MTIQVLPKWIGDYVQDQALLWRKFYEANNLREPMDLLSIPKVGDILVNEQTWSYKVHGFGVMFSNSQDGRIVDIHGFFDGAECFDAWRLGSHLESLKELKIGLLDCFAGDIDDYLKMLLDELEIVGLISRTGDLYRLY